MVANVFSIAAKRSTNQRLRLGVEGTFVVCIGKDLPVGHGLRILSRIFPELCALESDARLITSDDVFVQDCTDFVTGFARYGSPIMVDGKDLMVGIAGDSRLDPNLNPYFSIQAQKSDESKLPYGSQVLAIGWKDSGPFIVTSPDLPITQPMLLRHLREFADIERQRKPHKVDIQRDFGARYVSAGPAQIPVLRTFGAEC